MAALLYSYLDLVGDSGLFVDHSVHLDLMPALVLSFHSDVVLVGREDGARLAAHRVNADRFAFDHAHTHNLGPLFLPGLADVARFERAEVLPDMCPEKGYEAFPQAWRGNTGSRVRMHRSMGSGVYMIARCFDGKEQEKES